MYLGPRPPTSDTLVKFPAPGFSVPHPGGCIWEANQKMQEVCVCVSARAEVDTLEQMKPNGSLERQ